MPDSPSGQSADHWKQKYYDQLDRLDQKEEEWSRLETVLKRAIGRLSLAAEGHHKAVDRHIRDIRAATRDKVNREHLDAILDQLSDLLARLDEKQAAPDRQAITHLQTLLEQLVLPASLGKPRKKLLKQLNKATDESVVQLLNEVAGLIQQALATSSPEAPAEKKPGLLDRILKSSTANESDVDHQATARILSHVLEVFPWPPDLGTDVKSLLNQLNRVSDDNDLSRSVTELEKLARSVPDYLPHTTLPTLSTEQTHEDGFNSLRQWIETFINQIDNPSSPDGRLAAIRTLLRDANQQTQLDALAKQLSDLLRSGNTETAPETSVGDVGDSPVQPSIQELLIRLLEQLVVPPDLTAEVDHMKSRLEAETAPEDWRLLLKDVAALINSIRSRLQQEKHEFEDFLQQITGRLREMDEFLQIESESIVAAEKQGQAFDEKMHSEVQVIREDVVQATDLGTLKGFVESRLDVISQHIRDYREHESQRFGDAQHNIEQMQSKMQSMEQETQTLKKIIVEKNKQAMFDALTGIPNRFAYEKKITEEIARWKRFGHPLSLAIWDVDYFKKVNDTFGHKAGDKVLRTIAQLLNERIRETDFLARYGGEEFVMLLPGTKEEETLRLVNGLREKVESCGFHYHGDPVSITVSCGVSSFREGDSLEKVFDRADKALYRAKKNGRNLCVIAAVRSD